MIGYLTGAASHRIAPVFFFPPDPIGAGPYELLTTLNFSSLASSFSFALILGSLLPTEALCMVCYCGSTPLRFFPDTTFYHCDSQILPLLFLHTSDSFHGYIYQQSINAQILHPMLLWSCPA